MTKMSWSTVSNAKKDQATYVNFHEDYLTTMGLLIC